MKKPLALLTVIVAAVVLFSNWHTQKKAAAETKIVPAPTLSYAANVKSVVETNCTPCHIPSRGGNKKALDSYDNLKSSIDDVLSRIQLNPSDRGFMPFRGTKLSDSTIAIFKQWRDAGTPQ